MDRRRFLSALPALTLAPPLFPRLLAQSEAPPLAVRGLSQLTLTVSDIARSLAFYQGLFGMPIQARQGSTLFLRIGAGPQFLALKPAAPSERPSISGFGMGVENFSVDRVMRVLEAHGVSRDSAAAPRTAMPPMSVRLVPGTAGAGAAAPRAPEIFVGDPSGIVFQLHDPSYCGGAGPAGIDCRAPEPAPTKGLIATREMSHFTINVSDVARTVTFYQGLFGAPVQVRQGAAPAYGIGPGVHFLMFIGGGPGGPGRQGRPGGPGAPDAAGAPDGPGRGRGGAALGPRIDHACMSMTGFEPAAVTRTLVDYGLKALPNASRDPLVTYISLRMPNRGGAEGGTPELYFTDPDGLAIQLQDPSYCGGGGFLGDVCPPL
jgi:catechol 2,3-dioxygenase-like lactoylglutathione lyase family enzyme